MSRAPAPRSIRPRSGLSIAGLVFAALFGGYLAVDRLRPAGEDRLPLPGGDPAAGACTVWFVGSSTIARWATLARDMAPWDARRRGANGALIASITTRFARDPATPAPAAIIFYAGENDIAAGVEVPEVLADFDRFMALKTARFAAVPVVAVALKPSPSRITQRPQQNRFNAGLAARARQRRDLRFVDIRPLMQVEGRLGPFYGEDGLHMNAAGYARWTAPIRHVLAQAVPADICATDPHG